LIDIAPEIPGALTNGTEIPVQSFQKFENACFMRSSSFSEIPDGKSTPFTAGNFRKIKPEFLV